MYNNIYFDNLYQSYNYFRESFDFFPSLYYGMKTLDNMWAVQDSANILETHLEENFGSFSSRVFLRFVSFGVFSLSCDKNKPDDKVLFEKIKLYLVENGCKFSVPHYKKPYFNLFNIPKFDLPQEKEISPILTPIEVDEVSMFLNFIYSNVKQWGNWDKDYHGFQPHVIFEIFQTAERMLSSLQISGDLKNLLEIFMDDFYERIDKYIDVYDENQIEINKISLQGHKMIIDPIKKLVKKIANDLGAKLQKIL